MRESIDPYHRYPEVFDLRNRVFNENEEKSSGYIVCSVVSFGSDGFWEHVRGKPVSPPKTKQVWFVSNA